MMNLKRTFLFICIAILFSKRLFAQDAGLVSIKGLPTKEIYDLMIDKKGFLWIAHDLGLTRFDGLSMVDFTNERQTSLSISDLTEDENGRIWCHNFNGQIFYVENEKLQLHENYNAAQEIKFPRIVVHENQLVATSHQGLYVYDLKTKKSRYYFLNKQSTSSLTLQNNQVVAFGNGNWFTYSKRHGIKQLVSTFPLPKSDNLYLHPITDKDTLLVNNSFSGQLHKLTIKNDTVKLIQSLNFKDYINTLTFHKGALYVHTKKSSYELNGKATIPDLDLTDIVTDREGNTWYSSLKNGLLVRYHNKHYTKSNIINVKPGDFIRSIGHDEAIIAFGTQKGQVILYDKKNKKIILEKSIPQKNGAIERIDRYFNGDFLIGGSVGTWSLHKNGTLTLLEQGVSKDFYVYDHMLFAATTNGLIIKTRKGIPITPLKALFPSLQLKINHVDSSLTEEGRCRALEYKPSTKTLYLVQQNGLFAINRKGKEAIQYYHQKLNCSSLARSHETLFAGDFTKGLFVVKDNHIKNISTKDGLLSNTILKLSVFHNHLWIISNKGLQLFDIEKEKLLNDFILPPLNDGIVYDIIETDNKVWIATSDGMYEIILQQKKEKLLPEIYLLSALTNHKDTVQNGTLLASNQNNIQFNLSTPWFNNPNHIYFKYRLLNGKDKKWFATTEKQRTINYAALMPGKYTFQAIAATIDGRHTPREVTFDFEIKKPWWQQWWFTSFVVLLLSGFILTIINSYYRLRLNKEKARYEQLSALETERQRISDDIHDDISAGLTALKLYTGLTEQKTDNTLLKKDLAKIYGSVTHLSNQLREVIWTLNAEHNSLENLIYYLQQQATTLLENTNIELIADLPGHINDVVISGEKRRHIYLCVKEALQNVIKHAHATNVLFKAALEKNRLIITIADNGMGFKASRSIESSGLQNMQKRMNYIGGELHVETDTGVKLTFKIPL